MRNVDDPYGARLISLDPSYHSNPYILASSLADVERWPELGMPASPPISDDEGDNFSPPSGFPGATGLKYSQTIMGGRTGGLGLRIHGKRLSTSKRMSRTPRRVDIHIEDASPQESASNTIPADARGDSWVKLVEHDTGTSEAGRNPANENESAEKGAQFVPKFKGAAEMEARRKMRLLTRRGPTMDVKALPPVVAGLNPELSSSDEDEDDILDEEDDFDEITGTGNDIDDGDEFDP